jgi:hypothetical protein
VTVPPRKETTRSAVFGTVLDKQLMT